ncbi:MAG: hypothetical protein O3B42_05015 [Actinomycetota bacterium]|nr:hypothetical protein [Actinomycetota bacterium]
MNAYFMTNNYLDARMADTRVHMHDAMTPPEPSRRIRRALGLTLVRVGESILPDKSKLEKEAVTARKGIKTAA